jgi:hypothetical protein
MILHVLIAMVAGRLQRHQQQMTSYRLEDHRVRKAHLGARWRRLTDTARCRLAALAHPLGRRRLTAVATLTTPEILLQEYQRLTPRSRVTRHRRAAPWGGDPATSFPLAVLTRAGLLLNRPTVTLTDALALSVPWSPTRGTSGSRGSAAIRAMLVRGGSPVMHARVTVTTEARAQTAHRNSAKEATR